MSEASLSVMNNLSKTALVTGASNGVGYEVALALASKGISVIAVARKIDRLKALQDHFPNKIHIISADLANLESINKIVSFVSKETKIDYLINNAATLNPISPLEHITLEDFEVSYHLNVCAPIFLTNQLLPFFSEHARVLNVTTPAGCIPRAGLGAYCISKAALNMASLVQKAELQKHKVLVSRIFPGEVDTDMQKALREATDDKFLFAKEFKKEKENGGLISAKLSAKFFAWVLLETSIDDFSRYDWNIYDTEHHQYWLKEPLSFPFSDKKKEFYKTYNKICVGERHDVE